VLEMDYAATEDWPEHKRRIEDFALGHLERLIPGITKRIVVSTSASARTRRRRSATCTSSATGPAPAAASRR